MKVNIYPDIIKSYNNVNALKRDVSLPIDKFNSKDIGVCELEFDIKSIQNEEKLNEIVLDLLIRFNFFLQCFVCEDSFKSKSRVRSFKGIVDRAINKESYVQIEFDDFNMNKSLFCGILNFNLNTYDYINRAFSDSDTSFILGCKDKTLKKDFLLENTYSKALNNHNDVCLNYLKLFEEYCTNKKNILIRSGGDGINDFTIQIFYNKKMWKEKELKDNLRLK